jgi:hypothetical protein
MVRAVLKWDFKREWSVKMTLQSVSSCSLPLQVFYQNERSEAVWQLP